VNNKGQALVEALFLSTVLFAGFYLVINLGLKFIYQITLDEWVEEYTLCLATYPPLTKNKCATELKKKLISSFKNNLILKFENTNAENLLHISQPNEITKTYLVSISLLTQLNATK
jgi:hypothetical protein